MSHALITGGAGFLGSHLVDRLLAEGWKVTVLDNFDPFYPRAAKEANLAGCRARGWFRLVEADIRDIASLQSLLEGGYDVIVHLAARDGVRPSLLDPCGFQETNVCGTQNLLECARIWGVRQFVFASSASVYGANPRAPWREDDTGLRPISPVAGTKLSGELLGHVYSHLHGIRFVALRLFTLYGPRQRPDQAIHAFARAMIRGRAVEIHGDGSARRDYTYVGDAVDGIRAAMNYGDLAHEVINVAGGRGVNLCDMIRTLEGALGVTARLEFKPPHPGDVPETWANISKAQRLLGYHPRTSLEEGLYQFATWLTGVSASSLTALHHALGQAAPAPGPLVDTRGSVPGVTQKRER